MRRTSSTVITCRTLVGTSDTSPRSTKWPGLLGLFRQKVSFGVTMRRDAVDKQAKPEREPCARILRQHRLLVRQLSACGVPLQARLLVGGEAQHVVNDRACGQLGVGGVDARICSRLDQL